MPRKLTLRVTKRSDGRVCKRIDGEYVTWPDEDTARAELVELIRRRAAGVAGGTVPAMPPDPPLKVIADSYRHERMNQVKPGTWSDYDTAIRQFLAGVGKFKRVGDLSPDDFVSVRVKWASTLGPWKLDNRIQSVRTMFRWAAKTARLIEREPWYGDAFKKTTAAEKRRARREHEAEHGERKFTRGELREILRQAKQPLRAFILLALNCGMYAADIAQLTPSDLRKRGRLTLIDTERGKTGIIRRAILWPETVKEIQSLKRGADTLFVTYFGNAWVNRQHDSIGLLFRRLLDDLDIKRAGVGFGSLKHTHVSAVGAHPDLNAARLVRGHRFEGIEAHYDFPDLKRIKAVTDLARAKLLSSGSPSSRKRPASSARSATPPSRQRAVDHASGSRGHQDGRGRRFASPCRC